MKQKEKLPHEKYAQSSQFKMSSVGEAVQITAVGR